MAPCTCQVDDSGITRITLRDADRRNALSTVMFDALDAAVAAVDDEARCVVLEGEGPVFCSGFDMVAAGEDAATLRTFIERLAATVSSIRALPTPVVACAQGAAIAGGCALICGADFAVGSCQGRYGYPVHRLGLSPAVTLPALLPRIGGRARSLLLGSEVIDGSAAHAMGLLTHLVDIDDQVEDAANDLAVDLAAKPPLALRATKAWLNELDGPPVGGAAEGSLDSINDETVDRIRSILGV